MLTYSVRPRGGVVHAIELSRALAARGHQVELVALARPGEGFFRDSGVTERLIPHFPEPERSFDERIAAMADEYREGLRDVLAELHPDVIHAQDCLSGNAALDLRDEGVIPHVLRTVHHVDDFTTPYLVECQRRSIAEPDALLCVSAPWVERIENDFGRRSELVSNGVDARRFRPAATPAERLRDRDDFGFGGRHVVLAVGGIEPRKGSMTLLESFIALRSDRPDLRPLLVVAGGATLFDYRHEVDRFEQRLAEAGIGGDVRRVGSLPDDEIAALYRAADVFAFPSVKEGFGLAPLEALASGLPVVASDLSVFAGFLTDEQTALLVPVADAPALGSAVARLADDATLRAGLIERGFAVARRYSWDAAAAAHENAYGAVRVDLPTGAGR